MLKIKASTKQSGYFVLIEYNGQMIYDSGRIRSSSKSNNHLPGLTLRPGRDYLIKLTVYDNNNEIATYQHNFSLKAD